MKTPQDVRAIVQALKELYPDGICSLQYQKDYELLFATRLSAQCTDERVNQVTPAPTVLWVRTSKTTERRQPTWTGKPMRRPSPSTATP